MKYPIKIKDLIIERNEHYLVDGVERDAYRLRCKIEDGTPITAMYVCGPFPADLSSEMREHLEELACCAVLDAAYHAIRVALS